jgi:ElaB/YqjD/DUF883 family membrane-anchored ribosome-binding protein
MRAPGTMGNQDIGDAARNVTDKVSEAASQAKDYVANAAGQAKEKASEYGRMASQKIDQGRISTASGLESAASSMRSAAQSGGQAITQFANTAADRLQSSAVYVREHSVGEMFGDVEEVVRRNPGPSLIAAAAVGFLLGAALRRD